MPLQERALHRDIPDIESAGEQLASKLAPTGIRKVRVWSLVKGLLGLCPNCSQKKAPRGVLFLCAGFA